MFVKKNILSQKKGVSCSTFGNSPALGNIRLNVQVFVQLQQTVIQLIAGPKITLIIGKGRIQGRNIGKFIIPKNQMITAFLGTFPTGKKEISHTGKKKSIFKKLHDNFFFFLLIEIHSPLSPPTPISSLSSLFPNIY